MHEWITGIDNQKGRVTGGLRCTVEKYCMSPAINIDAINNVVLRRSTQHVYLCTELELKTAEGRLAVDCHVSLSLMLPVIKTDCQGAIKVMDSPTAASMFEPRNI